jgi:hypothetical protein
MVTTAHVIHVDPDSELARVLAADAAVPLYRESGGARFRIVRAADDLWADYDPEGVLEGLRTAPGTLTEEEGEELKALIYRAREEGSRPVDRP